MFDQSLKSHKMININMFNQSLKITSSTYDHVIVSTPKPLNKEQ